MALLKLSIVFLLIGASQTMYQQGRKLGENDYCNRYNSITKCGVGEGDCDYNSDCQSGLVCGANNCHGPMFDKEDDCCVKSGSGGRKLGDDDYCSRNLQCGVGEGDCDHDSDCKGYLVCGTNNCHGKMFGKYDDCCIDKGRKLGDDNYCSRNQQCGVGEGDCDHDSDCKGDLVCGTNNCHGKMFGKYDDCCIVSRHKGKNIGDDNYCSPKEKCGIGAGDCDAHSDCQSGLVCGKNNCHGAMFDKKDDCCVKSGPGGPKLGDDDYCNPNDNKCGVGEGDCNVDSDCQSGLICGTNNCHGDEFGKFDDCCVERKKVPKTYYLNFSFANSGPNVVVKWTQNGIPMELKIPSGQTVKKFISFKSVTQPGAMQFRIYEAGTGKILQSFQGTPTPQQGETKVIKISPVPKMYYINLSFVNSGPNVVVKWTQNGNPKELNIFAGHTYPKSISFKSATKPAAIIFRIYEVGTQKVLQSFQVTPTLQQGETKVLKIGPVPKMYYISLTFVNTGPNVVVKWTQNGNAKVLNIFSGQTYPKSISFMSATQPSAMQFRIYEAGTEKVLQSFQLTPTLQQVEAKVIKIGPVAKMYYYQLSFANSGPDVVVKWTQNGNPKELNIASGHTKAQTFSFKSVTQPSAIPFIIYEASTGKVVQSFQVTPTLQQGHSMLIKIAPKMYHIKLSFVNSGPNVVVKWTQNGNEKMLNVFSGQTYPTSINFMSVTQPSAIQFRIYEAGTEKVLQSFQETPTLQQGETMVIKIGPVAKMYHINLRFLNPGPDVVVKWTQNGNPKELNIASGHIYEKSISFKSVTQPSALQFTIIEAGTGKVLQSFQVTPTLQQVEAKDIKIGPVAKMYYINLSFINSQGPNVVVKWTLNGEPKELYVASGYTYTQKISFKSATQPSAMQFRIYEAGTEKVVKYVRVTPTLQQVVKVIKIS